MEKVTKIGGETSNDNKKLKVAAYCRVSTDSDEQLESLEAQKSTIKLISKAILRGSMQDCITMKASLEQR